MNRSPNKRSPSPAQSAAQQAVLNKLRSGGTIQGAQPNNPLAYAAQFFDPRRLLAGKPPTSSIPNLRGGMVGGREALIAPGGWNKDTAGLGEITVGGQRFFPAQSGKDLVYQRAPGQIGGQYGSIRVPNQLASSVEESANTPEERAYQQELSRTAQITAQDPELQRYEAARVKAKTQEEMNSVRDMGLAMWAKANPKLAAKVQPGQSGFDTIYKQTGQVPTPTFNPLMERTFPGMSRGAGEYTMGPSPLVPQVDQALNPASPTYALGEGPSLMNFSDENVTPEMIKAFQEQLLKQAASK
jgi:hypothetical protein